MNQKIKKKLKYKYFECVNLKIKEYTIPYKRNCLTMEEINLNLDSGLKTVDLGSTPEVSNVPIDVSLQSSSPQNIANVPSIGTVDDFGIDLLVNKSKMGGEIGSGKMSNSLSTPSPSLKVENTINLDKLLEDTPTTQTTTSNNLFSMNTEDTSSNILNEPASGSLFSYNTTSAALPPKATIKLANINFFVG